LGRNDSRFSSGYESVEASSRRLVAVAFQKVSIVVFVAACEREQRART
jgi:hypothetical protein